MVSVGVVCVYVGVYVHLCENMWDSVCGSVVCVYEATCFLFRVIAMFGGSEYTTDNGRGDTDNTPMDRDVRPLPVRSYTFARCSTMC